MPFARPGVFGQLGEHLSRGGRNENVSRASDLVSVITIWPGQREFEHAHIAFP